MPTRFLSDAQRARLVGWPVQIAVGDLTAFFTLALDDLRWLRRQRRDAANLLGLAVQLCALPWLGFVPADLSGCPAAATARLAYALDLDATAGHLLLAGYGGFREQTRRVHFREVLTRLGWRTVTAADRKQLDELLAARAMEHDSPTVLLEQAYDWLRRERAVRPGVDRLARRVAAAREAADAVTYQRVAALLNEPRTTILDQLLVVDLGWGRPGRRGCATARLPPRRDCRHGATAATAEAIRTAVAKLAFLHSLGAHELDAALTAAELPRGRRRFLAEIGRRATNTALSRSEPGRPHPVLLATLGRDTRRGPRRAGADRRPGAGRRGRPGASSAHRPARAQVRAEDDRSRLLDVAGNADARPLLAAVDALRGLNGRRCR